MPKDKIGDFLKLKTHPDISNILDIISEFVKTKGGTVSTHQVRRIYNEVKKADNRIALQLLRPKIVYTIARSKEGKNG
jgi:CRISPR/Cas system CSM-associated protein Csm2 small subunit